MRYTLYPELEERIRTSRLDLIIEKKNSPIVPYWINEDSVLEYLKDGVWRIATEEAIWISKRIKNLLEQEDLRWRLWWSISIWDQWELFPKRYKPGIIYNWWWREIVAKMEDLVLMTGWLVREVLWIKTIKSYKKYWYNSMIDFVMEVSAYLVSKERITWREPYSWIRWWRETTITWDTHWDFRLFQIDRTNYSSIISPFWNKVWFKHREIVWWINLDQMSEINFLSIILSYAKEIWYDLRDTIEKILKESNNLNSFLWNFWDFWWGDDFDEVTLESNIDLVVKYWIKDFSISKEPIEWSINFNIKENRSLEVTDEEWNFLCSFNPEDIWDLIKWVLVQCANWLWRTSKQRVENILKLYLERYAN